MTTFHLTGTRTGLAHTETGLPNQDAVLTRTAGADLLIALADGAGSAEAAAEGAQITAQAALDALEDPGVNLAATFKQLLTDRLATQPLPPQAYHATITAARVTPDGHATLLHCGDGLIIAQAPGQADLHTPIPATGGEYASQTVFPATSPEEAIRTEQLPVTFLLLSTDGLTPLLTRQEQPHGPAVTPLSTWPAHPNPEEQRAMMDALLTAAQNTGRTDDDLTLALISVS